jgi:sec-independent protein translocase protein TatA
MGLPNIGPLELIIILAIALLIVGPRRLPEMGSAVGRTIREFRKASTEMTDAASVHVDTKPAEPPQPAALGPGNGSVSVSLSAPDTASVPVSVSAPADAPPEPVTAASDDTPKQA